MNSRTSFLLTGVALIFYFILGLLSPWKIPSTYYYLLWEMCTDVLAAGLSVFEKIVNVFKASPFGEMYKPFFFLMCPISRMFGSHILPYKILFSFSYSIWGGLFTWLFLHLTKKYTAFFAILLTGILPPVIYNAWLQWDPANFYGSLCIVGTAVIYFSSHKHRLLSVILAIGSAFSGELSRLYMMPFLIFLGICYPKERNKSFLILMNLFMWSLSLIIHLFLTRTAIEFSRAPLYSLLFYSSFMADYFIYITGYAGVLVLGAYFFKYINTRLASFSFSVYLLLSLTVILSMPVFSFSNIGYNFFFVTISTPWNFSLFLLILLISMIYSFKNSSLPFEKFSILCVIVFPLMLMFMTGIFPRMRTDPSSRHLLLMYPFLSFLLIEGITFYWKSFTRKKILVSLIAIFSFYTICLNLFEFFYNSRKVEDLGRNLRVFMLRHRHRFCFYILGPHYYIISYESLIAPWRFESDKIFYVKSNVLTDLAKFLEEWSAMKGKCAKDKILLLLRDRPLVDPLYIKPGKRFFQQMKKFSKKWGDDQLAMAYYAEMHTSKFLPVERYLHHNATKVFYTEFLYYHPPIFINELIHRIRYKIPFLLPYKMYFEAYKVF